MVGGARVTAGSSGGRDRCSTSTRSFESATGGSCVSPVGSVVGSCVTATCPISPWVSTLYFSAAGYCVTAASENNVTKLSTLCISAPEGEERDCSGMVGVRDLRMMGGELGIMGLVGLTTIDDRVFRLGKELGKLVIFLFRPLSFRMGELSGIAAALTEALVLLLFGGVSVFYCFFLLRKMMGVLSSESSVEI